MDPSGNADFGGWSPSTGGYRRIGELAAGGMGTVSLCVKHAGRFERLYAVKRLHPHLRRDDAMRRMFLDEARVAGLVRHANVVSVLDVGEDDEGPFLVMDYVEGTALSRFIRHHIEHGRSIPVVVCAQIVAQAARGLHAAHELVDPDGQLLHLVHRDVSPSNILLGIDGVVRVTDFGVAKALGRSTHTSTGLLKGKVGYMAPEHLRFEPLDRRTDLFALGVVLVEALIRRRLYSATDAAAAARRVLHEPPPDLGDERPEVPPALVELTYELLAKDPADRPATAAEVADRLDEIVAELGHADVAAYLEATMGPELAQQRAQRRELAQQAEAVPPAPEPTIAEPPAGAAVDLRDRNGRTGLVVGTIAIVGALAAGWIWMRSSVSALPQIDVATTPTPVTPPAAFVVVHVDSRPPGATLDVDDRTVGKTPFELRLPTDDDDEVTLSLSLDGYESTTHAWVPTRSEHLVFNLAPARETAPRTELAGDDATVATPEPRPKAHRGPRRAGTTTRPKPSTDEPPSTDPDKPRFRRFD